MHPQFFFMSIHKDKWEGGTHDFATNTLKYALFPNPFFPYIREEFQSVYHRVNSIYFQNSF